MSGIAVFLPSFELLQIADRICRNSTKVIICKKLLNENIEAAVRGGAGVIVARGSQAAAIRYLVNIPVVDIVWTAQELGLTILKAKEAAGKADLSIGIAGLKSMFCDTTYFEALYGVKIKTFYYNSLPEKELTLREVEASKVDALIGVQDLLNQLPHLKIPMLPVISTEESVRLALNQAETLCYVDERKRRNKAQVNSLLNSMFSGLMEIDAGGHVVMVNRVMEGILNKGQDEVLGKSVKEVVKDINMNLVQQVLNSPQESFSSFLNVNGKATVVILSPIVMEDKITGAYLSLKKIKKSDEINEAGQEGECRSGFTASRTFDDICYTSEKMTRMIQRAKLYARSNTPLMIEGQTGDDRKRLCQGIHNYSLRKNGPYVIVSMVGLSEERQMEKLFGSGYERRGGQRIAGALEKANGGTLVITGIGFASAGTQSAICRFVRENPGVMLGNGEGNGIP